MATDEAWRATMKASKGRTEAPWGRAAHADCDAALGAVVADLTHWTHHDMVTKA